jgi:serine protease
MTLNTILRALLPAILLAACGGGGGDDTPTPAEGTLTLTGTVTAASNVVVDSDTNDPDSVYIANNTLATAQAIGNPVMVGGFVTATPTLGARDRYTLIADPDDVYAVDLVAGQDVSLEIINSPDADIDLGLYDTAGTLIDASVGVARFESVTATTSGRYYLRVNAFSGKSNYVLSIGTGATPAYTGLRLASDFVADEAVVNFHANSVQNAGIRAMGYEIKAGRSERPMLLGLAGPRLAMSGGAGLIADFAGARIGDDAEAKLRTLYQIKALQGRSEVASADPNFRVKALRVPNDPYYGYQWHYPMINLPQAWDITTGTPASGSVVVAVVDTGVVLSHADLANSLFKDGGGNVVGYDFIRSTSTSNDGDGIDANADDPGDESTPSSSSWHGTHVAGTIAAGSNNGVGVAGVSWGAKIMPVRVIGKGGGTSYDVLQGIRYAAGLANDSGTLPAKRADIINLSLGCVNCYSASEQALFNQVRAAGVIVIAAAGNENTSQLGYPASYDGVVSVSALAMDRTRAPYSNYGAKVDVAAPGGDTSRDSNGDGYADGILSTLVSGTRTSDYRFYQGTSMASPHVAGVAALMKAVHPAMTPAEFDAMLASGQLTTDLGTAGRDDIYGWGLIDAAKAVLAAQNAASGIATATLSASPGRLDFGAGLATLALDITKLGGGTLAVSGVSDDQTWLVVTPGGIDASGLGAYTASVNRTGLAAGSYSATITVRSGTGASLSIPVSMQVGTAARGNSGHYWILLLDQNLEMIKQVSVEGSNSQYPYRFDNVAAGAYYIYAGTDSDWDDFICDDGEVCGAYPTLGQPTPVEISASRTGLDFSAGIVSTPSTLSQGAASGNLFKLRHDTRGGAVKGVNR